MSAPHHHAEPEGRPDVSADKVPPQEGQPVWPSAGQPLPAKGGPPAWKRWRQPVVGYVAAVLLQALAVLLTWLLMQAFPLYDFPATLPVLVVACVALTWGAGPSILAMLLGVVLIDYFLLSQHFSWSDEPADLIGLAVFLLVGLIISRLAGQNKRARSKAEALAGSLESERARLQAIFEALPNPITFHDAQGTLINANLAGRQGIDEHASPATLEMLPGAYHIRTAQGSLLPADQLPVARALRGETVDGMELCISGEDGSERIMLTGAAPIRSRQGRIEGAVVTSSDVTPLRRAEQEATLQRQQLQALLTLTDTALTHLSLDAFVSELLIRLREVMDVDAATILLLSEEKQELSVHATLGLGEGSAHSVHIPVGQGFAGKIAASRQPLIVEDTSTFESYGSRLKEQLRSLVGVPLMIGERILGVVHVGTVAPRHFTQEEVQLLQRAADRIALALDLAALYASARAARAEAEQRAGELEGVIQAITDGVFIYGPQGETRLMNMAAHAMLGFDAQPSAARLSVQERVRVLEAYDERGQVMRAEQFPAFRVVHGETLDSAHGVDMRLRSLDGGEVQVNCTGAPIRDACGRQIGAVLVARDVTERRRLERRSEEALQAMLEVAQVLVEEPVEETISGQDGRALRVVARRLAELACRVIGGQRTGFFRFEPETAWFHPLAVVGLSPEQEQQWLADPGQGHRLGDNLAPEQAERFAAGGVIVVDMRQPPLSTIPNLYQAQTVLAAPLKIGQRLVGEFALDFGPAPHDFTPHEIALAGAVGKLAALVVERERLLREREDARSNVLALREANRRMDEFLGIASHELRTPLTKIKTSMQLAEHRARLAISHDRAANGQLAKTLQPMQEMIGRAVRSVDVVNRLVGDLLDVSRIQANRLEMLPAPVDLTQVVREAVEEQRELFPSRTITLTVPEDAPVLVTADADRIAQVVINYLTNALKYSPMACPVEVGVRRCERAASVWVRDHGPGIPREAQQRLWDRFYQASGVAVQHGSSVGLGLGLYISKTIIERHEGQVGVESASGEGAAFWFTLPLAGSRSM